MNSQPLEAAERYPETPREVARWLDAAGRRPSRALGQNFLFDRRILLTVVDSAEVTACDRIVEIGCGLGNLTRWLVPRARFVRAVDRDSFLLSLCRRFFPPSERLDYWEGDCLAGKRALDPGLVRALDRDQAAHPDAPEKWVANLPYGIAGPLLAILMSTRAPVRRITCTIQKEMADRVTARPGERDYGPLAILASLAGEARVVRVFGPGAFWPPPTVDSAILDLVIHADRPPQLARLAAWLPGLFGQRRKTLAAALARTDFRGHPTAEIAQRLAGIGLDPARRAEQLSPGDFLELIRLT